MNTYWTEVAEVYYLIIHAFFKVMLKCMKFDTTLYVITFVLTLLFVHLSKIIALHYIYVCFIF